MSESGEDQKRLENREITVHLRREGKTWDRSGVASLGVGRRLLCGLCVRGNQGLSEHINITQCIEW